MAVLQSVPELQAPDSRKDPPAVMRPALLAALIAALFFLAIAPTLTWIEFSGGMENFNLETALEMTRDGHWIIPTLDGQARTKKPPLATWITALGILGSKNLAWGARWPSLLMASLTLILVYDLGRQVGGARLGLVAACIAGGSLVVLQFARQASYDTQFAFWVVLTNVFLARIVLRDQWRLGCIGAGIALGLALMTKGPPAFLLTVIPPLMLLMVETLRRYSRRADIPVSPEVGQALPAAPELSGGRCPPYGARNILARQGNSDCATDTATRSVSILIGLILCLAVALPWTLYAIRVHPGRLSEWYLEVTLAAEGRLENRFGRWLSYLAFVGWIVPWTVWFVGGFASACALWWKRREPIGIGNLKGIALMLAWVLVPLIGMSFFPERRERYALPIIGPAAVLAGWAMLEYLGALGRPDTNSHPAPARWPLALHWIIVTLIAIGFPVLGAVGIKQMRTVDGRPWFSPAVAAGGAAVTMAIVLALFRWRRPTAATIAAGGFLVMLVVQLLGAHGYAKSPLGRSEARPLVDAVLRQYPDAIVYNAVNRSRRRDLPLEMTIYFNRVVPRAEHVSKLRPGGRPQAIVFPDGAEHAPEGFVRVARQFIKEEWWNAYVLPARQ